LPSIIKLIDHKKITIPIIIAGLFIFVLVYVVGLSVIEDMFSPDIFGVAGDKFLEDNFVRLGILVIFFYELIPFTFRFITDSGFFVGLLQAQISPIVLLIIVVIGKLTGYYILYILGRGVSRILRGKNKELAGAEHILHKYKFFVFLAVPFLGSIGDVVVLIAGHERLGFIKILPLLFISGILRTSIWLFPFMAQLELPNLI